MSLADSLGSLVPETPRRLDAQTPKRSAVEMPKRSDTQAARHSDGQAFRRSDVQTSGRLALSQDPDRVKKTLYVREESMDAAFAKYKASHGRKSTESDLVEMLLQNYGGGRG